MSRRQKVHSSDRWLLDTALSSRALSNQAEIGHSPKPEALDVSTSSAGQVSRESLSCRSCCQNAEVRSGNVFLRRSPTVRAERWHRHFVRSATHRLRLPPPLPPQPPRFGPEVRQSPHASARKYRSRRQESRRSPPANSGRPSPGHGGLVKRPVDETRARPRRLQLAAGRIHRIFWPPIFFGAPPNGVDLYDGDVTIRFAPP